MDLREKSICLLASVSGVDMKTVAKEVLYTIPVGKKCIITHVIIRDPTDSLLGGTEYDLGDGANCDTWVQDTNLAGMTSTAHYYVVHAAAVYVIFDAGDVFGIKPITGSTAAADATLDVFGYLYDA